MIISYKHWLNAKPIVLVCLVVLTLVSVACTGVQPPYQTLYEAKTAINAAKQKIGPCPCQALTPAENSYQQAKTYQLNGQYDKAKSAANQALKQAQDILRSH